MGAVPSESPWQPVVGLAGEESPREDLAQVDTSEAPESPTEELSDDVIF